MVNEKVILETLDLLLNDSVLQSEVLASVVDALENQWPNLPPENKDRLSELAQVLRKQVTYRTTAVVKLQDALANSQGPKNAGRKELAKDDRAKKKTGLI